MPDLLHLLGDGGRHLLVARQPGDRMAPYHILQAPHFETDKPIPPAEIILPLVRCDFQKIDAFPI